MESKNLLQKYYQRLSRESWLKAWLWGLVVGFSAALLTSAVIWFFGAKIVWLTAIVFVVATVAAALLFYYKAFKPTIKQAAKRADALGLEERLITMTELEGSDTVMAKLQREDAKKALSTVSAGLIKIAISTALIVTVSSVAVGAAGMTTLAALAAGGTIKPPIDIIVPEVQLPKYEVVYEVTDDEAGMIDGEDFQLVQEGDDAEPVTAVAFDGYVFSGWFLEDGTPYSGTKPERQDLEIKGNLKLIAAFQLYEDDPDGEEGDDGDGDGDSAEQKEDGDQGNKPGDKPGPGEGGQYNANDNIIDGETPYGGETYNTYHEEAKEEMENDDTISDDRKGFCEDYFKNIKK